MQNMTITQLYWGATSETLFLAINIFIGTISEVDTQGNKVWVPLAKLVCPFADANKKSYPVTGN